MNKENKKETVLTVDELERLGEKLGDNNGLLKLMINAMNLAPRPKQVAQGKDTDFMVSYYTLYELVETMFSELQRVSKDVDYTSYILQENSDKMEIDGQRERGRL